jgi:2,4-dienoyl-CoA reductase-like NADH-dependent reductase (Old Yellow Enzyme family)
MVTSLNKVLLEPITIGGTTPLRNRICMGALTRNRCIDNNKPTEASRVHYATRAKDGTGLIIAEGTFPYLNGSEWLDAPMMYNDEHADAWKKVTTAVHNEGGKIFFQTWHAGEIFLEFSREINRLTFLQSQVVHKMRTYLC